MKDSNKKKTLLSSLTALGLMIVCVNNPLVLSVNIEEQKKLRAELKNHRQELEDSLRNTKEKVKSETENKKSLDQQIETVKNKIDESNRYINELNKQIEKIQVRINEMNEEIKRKTSLLKETLVSIYVAGDTSALDIILGSKSFDDFLDKADIVRSVSGTVKELMDSLKISLDELEKEEKNICEMKDKQKEEVVQLEKSKVELQDLLDKSEKLILEYKENEIEAKKEIDHNDAEIKAIDAQITKYYEEQRKREEEERRKKLQKQCTPASTSKPNNSVDNILALKVSKSGYAWPVPGFRYISSGFNDCVNRSHMHGAIDVAGKGIYGSNIVAANEGIVIMSNNLVNKNGQGGGGYGKFVVIDHGNGVSTLYGHMSNVVVSPGQRVSRGQVIGQVGNTGFSTGPHLHFEFRVHGIRQNPLNYIGG